MREAEEVSVLVGEIYDAALDPSLWPGVLAKVAEFVNGQTAGLLSKDSVNKLGNVHYNFGVEDRYLKLYRETYWRVDPLTPLLFYDVGQVTSVADLMSHEEFQQGRFYKEWAEPQGWIDAANVVLEKSAASCAVLSVIRSRAVGMVDAEMRWRMGLIVPHVRRAVLVGKVIELKTAKAATLADTLDRIAAAMYLVDANGRMVHANAAGYAMLADADVVRACSGRLIPCDAQTEQPLGDVFASVASGDALGIKGIALPLKSLGEEPYVAHVLPLTSGARRRAGASYAAVAAVFVRKATVDIPSAPEIIAKHFSLTPTELRVLLAIVEIGGVPETAEALGIGEATVKTHLHRLFHKTGAKRQADLVKLVAGFSMAVGY
jgi:DNA-binding CsgD family transcriptional regulator